MLVHADYVHVGDEKKRAGGIGDGAAAEAGDDGTAAGCEIENVGWDALLGENAGDVFCGGLFVARGIRGVDLDQINEPVLRLQCKG